MVNRERYSGIGMLFGFSSLSALREVFLASTLRQVSIFALIFLVFSVTSVVFLPLLLRDFSSRKERLRSGLFEMVLINLSTLLAWIGYIVALRNLEPSYASALATSLIPLFSLLGSLLFLRGAQVTARNFVAASGILFFVIWIAYQNAGAAPWAGGISAAIGLVAGVVAAFGNTLNNIWSKRLAQKGFSGSETMAIRFWLLIVVAGLGVSLDPPQSSIPIAALANILGIALVGISLPLWLLQVGISKIGVVVAGVVMATVPAQVLVLQSIATRETPSFPKVIAILGIAVCVSMQGMRKETPAGRGL